MSFLLFTSNTFLDAIFGRTYGCNHEGIYSFNYIWICRYEHFIRRQYWLHLYLSISLSGFWLPLWYFQTLLPAIFVFNYFASFHIFVSQNVSLLFKSIVLRVINSTQPFLATMILAHPLFSCTWQKNNNVR